MIETFILCFFFLFAIIIPIGLLYWKFLKIDLDKEEKPYKKINEILHNNALVIGTVAYIVFFLFMYCISH